jgi:hypothetical protein
MLAPAALAGLAVRRHAGVAASLLAGRIPLSLAISGAIYAAMTFVSYQSWPDAILLGPIVACVLAIGLFRLLGSRLSAAAATAMTALILALTAVPDARPKFHPPVDFHAQRERYRALALAFRPKTGSSPSAFRSSSSTPGAATAGNGRTCGSASTASQRAITRAASMESLAISIASRRR